MQELRTLCQQDNSSNEMGPIFFLVGRIQSQQKKDRAQMWLKELKKNYGKGTWAEPLYSCILKLSALVYTDIQTHRQHKKRETLHIFHALIRLSQTHMERKHM